MRRLESPTDASLSELRSWHADRDSELAVWRAAAERAARHDTWHQLVAQNPAAAPPSTAGRIVAPDHTARTDAAAHDIARKRQPESSPIALGSNCRFLDKELTV